MELYVVRGSFNCRLTSLLFTFVTIYASETVTSCISFPTVAGTPIFTPISVRITRVNANITCKYNYKSVSLLLGVAPISPVNIITNQCHYYSG